MPRQQWDFKPGEQSFDVVQEHGDSGRFRPPRRLRINTAGGIRSACSVHRLLYQAEDGAKRKSLFRGHQHACRTRQLRQRARAARLAA
jgi:hypothetical protein